MAGPLAGEQLAVALFTAGCQDAPGADLVDLLATATRDDIETALLAITGVLAGVLTGYAAANGLNPSAMLAHASREFGLQVARHEAGGRR